jgi:hypothetical protein
VLVTVTSLVTLRPSRHRIRVSPSGYFENTFEKHFHLLKILFKNTFPPFSRIFIVIIRSHMHCELNISAISYTYMIKKNQFTDNSNHRPAPVIA